MRDNFDAQRINTSSPLAATQLLKMFYENRALSKRNSDFLRKLMTETSAGTNRIRGQLPKEATVAHKTGTSDINLEGVTIATNDIGVITLPNGNHFAISVFVANSKDISYVLPSTVVPTGGSLFSFSSYAQSHIFNWASVLGRTNTVYPTFTNTRHLIADGR